MKTIIALLLYSLPAFGFSVLPPHEFSYLSQYDRIYVLEETWNHRYEIIEEMNHEGYENPKSVFFHMYHQMLIIDNELSKIYPVLLAEKEKEFKD